MTFDCDASRKRREDDAPSAERQLVCLEACAGIPTAELKAGILLELVAACVHLRDDERVRSVLERLTASPASRPLRLLDGASDSISSKPAEPVLAREKFRVGMRVKMTGPAPVRARRRSNQRRTGIVHGFSVSPFHVRIIPAGRRSSETFHVNQWERDPAATDMNERTYGIAPRSSAARDNGGSAAPD